MKKSPLGLSNDVRTRLIKEPFQELAQQIEQSPYAKVNIDLKALLAIIIGTISIIWPFAIASSFEYTEHEETYRVISWIIALLSISVILYSLTFSDRRGIKKKYLPLLILALTPLKPTPEELQQISDFYNTTKAKIGKKWLYRAIINRLNKDNNTQETSPNKSSQLTPKKGDYVKAFKTMQK